MSRFNLKKEEKNKEQVLAKTALLNEKLNTLKIEKKDLEESMSSAKDELDALEVSSAERKDGLEAEIRILEEEKAVLKKNTNRLSDVYSGISMSLAETEADLVISEEMLSDFKKDIESISENKDSLSKKLAELENNLSLRVIEVKEIEYNIKEKDQTLKNLKSEVEGVQKELGELRESFQKNSIISEETTKKRSDYKDSLQEEIESKEEVLRGIQEKIERANIEYKGNLDLMNVQLAEAKEKKIKALHGIKDIESREVELTERERNFNIANKELKVKTRVPRVLVKEHDIKDLL